MSAIAGADENGSAVVDLARLFRDETERLRATYDGEAITLAASLPEVTVKSSRTPGEAVSVLAAGGRTTVSAALDGDEAGRAARERTRDCRRRADRPYPAGDSYCVAADL